MTASRAHSGNRLQQLCKVRLLGVSSEMTVGQQGELRNPKQDLRACTVISCLHNHLAQTCSCGSSSGVTDCNGFLMNRVHGIQTQQSRNTTVIPRVSARRNPLYHRLEIWLVALIIIIGCK